MTKNERDTKFLGFAKLLQQELIDLYAHEYGIDRRSSIVFVSTEWQKRNQTLIAQRVYDLMEHPDLTEWPPTEQER